MTDEDTMLDLALDVVMHGAIAATRLGATSDQLEACVRRGLLIARPPTSDWTEGAGPDAILGCPDHGPDCPPDDTPGPISWHGRPVGRWYQRTISAWPPPATEPPNTSGLYPSGQPSSSTTAPTAMNASASSATAPSPPAAPAPPGSSATTGQPAPSSDPGTPAATPAKAPATATAPARPVYPVYDRWWMQRYHDPDLIDTAPGTPRPPSTNGDPAMTTHLGQCECQTQCGTGPWHTQPIGTPWRRRDTAARILGWHCWDCARNHHKNKR